MRYHEAVRTNKRVSSRWFCQRFLSARGWKCNVSPFQPPSKRRQFSNPASNFPAFIWPQFHFLASPLDASLSIQLIRCPQGSAWPHIQPIRRLLLPYILITDLPPPLEVGTAHAFIRTWSCSDALRRPFDQNSTFPNNKWQKSSAPEAAGGSYRSACRFGRVHRSSEQTAPW